MMHKLKKRRPSGADKPTFRSEQQPSRLDQVPLKLNDVSISRGDFRGSTIIANLSNRFSVLRIPDDESGQFRASGPVPPLPQGVFTLNEMRDRLAKQRLNDAETYMTVEEEAAVLADLEDDIRAQSQQNSDLQDLTGHYALSGLEDPDLGTQAFDGRAALSPIPPGSYRSASRPYGIGSSGAMREAETMRKAKRTAERQRQSPTVEQSTSTPSKGDEDKSQTEELHDSIDLNGSVPSQDSARTPIPWKRESALAGMSTAARNRVSRALLQVEADLIADSMRDLQANPLPIEAREAMRTPVKAMGSSRRNVSISRSPAFHDRLADVADEGDTEVLPLATNIAATSTTQHLRNDDDVFAATAGPGRESVVPGRAPGPSANSAGSTSHRPHPLDLANVERQLLPAQREYEMPLRAGPATTDTFILETEGAGNLDQPSALAKSSLSSIRTGSYVAETPPESAQLTVPQQEVISEQPLPSPQSATFDISGYYGDDRDSELELEAVPMAADEDLTPTRSTHSSDYQSSATESDYDAVPATTAQHQRANNYVALQPLQQSEKALGLSSADLHHVQEKLTDAARQVRRTMNEGRTVGSSGSSPRNRRRPSNSTDSRSGERQFDESVAGLDEALYPRSGTGDGSSRPSHAIARRLSLLSSPAPVDASAVSPVQIPHNQGHALPQPRDTWTDLQTGYTQESQTSPPDPGVTVIDSVGHEAAKSRLAQALFGPAEALGGPPSPVGPTHSHRRLESTSSARSYRIDEDPDVRRDFEARIAQATAALQKTPSMRLSRKNTRNKAIKIGSPTLLQTSANLQVSPLTSPQVVQGGFVSPGAPLGRTVPRPRHGKSASVSSLANVETASSSANGGVVASGFKGLLAKIKRKPSQKKSEAVRQAPTGHSIVIPSTTQQGDRGAPPINPNSTLPKRSTQGVARRSIVRRTIIVPTNTHGMPSIVKVATRTEHDQVSSGPPERSLSIKRKPVQRTSEDIVLEKQLRASPFNPVQVPRSRQSSASGRDSVFDLYRVGDTDETGQETSFQPESGAGSDQVLEIRELSDGEVTWGLVRGQRESTRGDVAPRQASQIGGSIRDSAQDSSSASSYRKDSVSSSNFDLDEDDQDAAWSEAERELLDSPAERPQTKVFYSSSSNLQDLLADLSNHNNDGHFRILPQTIHEDDQDNMTTSRQKEGNNIESRLQALVSKIQASR